MAFEPMTGVGRKELAVERFAIKDLIAWKNSPRRRPKSHRNNNMNEYEEIRNEIDTYLMKRFKYRVPLVHLTSDNVVSTRRNSRIDLYLRIRRVESLFPPDCLIIAPDRLFRENA